mgnify:CR=1 FL=1
MSGTDNKKFWERAAKVYTRFHEKGNRDIYAALTKHIEPLLRADMTLLELACGTGQLIVPLAERVKHWTATDYAHGMVKETARRVTLPNVDFAVEDATCLTLPDAAFDTVIIANALHIMPDPDAALREIHRVLKPGGLLIAPTFVYEGNINNFRQALMKLVGFKTYHRWTLKSYQQFVCERGFKLREAFLIQGKLLPLAVLTATRDT